MDHPCNILRMNKILPPPLPAVGIKPDKDRNYIGGWYNEAVEIKEVHYG